MKRLIRIVLLITSLMLVGTAWFWLVEEWSLLDSVYMTVITLSTVGYGGRPLTEPGQAFVIVFLITGVGVFLYGVVQLAELVVRAELRQWWKEKHMADELKSLHNHFIVCGCGRMGLLLCEHMAARKIPFVVIDRDEESLNDCHERGWPTLSADATDDRTLIDAGIDRARGLAAVLSSDADNLYLVLSARLCSNGLRVVSRAYDEKGVRKLEKAGADRVVSLYASGATKMAHLLTNPKLDDFFEFVTEEGVTIDLAEIRIDEGSPFAGKPLSETDFRQRGIMIVGIRRPHGEVLLPPTGSTVIQPGDELFALGNTAAISEFAA